MSAFQGEASGEETESRSRAAVDQSYFCGPRRVARFRDTQEFLVCEKAQAVESVQVEQCLYDTVPNSAIAGPGDLGYN